ncbi:hypothetical protein F5Y00DRAFT_260999 [Daldinia vernicosa]|uniref:uncharacterized protein n=1 Tax=Daldinia vernicosa TaxID=114800 RepID=UPI00200772B1|nr:uncharacterized protein F5Y00DRAFT_260999 [Daldinia vernicosa]KAI0849893.1 hypothetical protein F5Y00DRAFT_260999 [Daldinia vernicosa]
MDANMDIMIDYSEEQKSSLDDLPEFMWDYGGKLRLTMEEWQEAKNGYTDAEIQTALPPTAIFQTVPCLDGTPPKYASALMLLSH